MPLAYQLTNIKYAYVNTLALSLSKLVIQAHRSTALIGSNGCGKSTLLHLLAFLNLKQQGQIQFFSETVDTKNIAILRKHIAFLPQKPYMLRGSVIDNLNLTLRFHNIKKNKSQKINQALEVLGISDLSHKNAKKLSGGEQQKVALARAIVSSPDVLLMDEPFSYLDHQSEQRLEQFMNVYVKEQHKTIIFSTHNRLQGVAIADDIISLIKGKPVETALINVFSGKFIEPMFHTGKIEILLANNAKNPQHVSIDPREIVLSKQSLHSSMRNQYYGKVTSISEEQGQIRVAILAGELFQALITPQAFIDLNISLGSHLWVNFKSNALYAF